VVLRLSVFMCFSPPHFLLLVTVPTPCFPVPPPLFSLYAVEFFFPFFWAQNPFPFLPPSPYVVFPWNFFQCSPYDPPPSPCCLFFFSSSFFFFLSGCQLIFPFLIRSVPGLLSGSSFAFFFDFLRSSPARGLAALQPVRPFFAFPLSHRRVTNPLRRTPPLVWPTSLSIDRVFHGR